MDYLENSENSNQEIKGLKLNIDPQIQQLCEVSNNSSSNTRGIIYVLVVMSVVSLIGILNTSIPTNWTNDRIEDAKSEYKTSVENKQSNAFDSIDCMVKRIALQKEVENKSDKIEFVQLPIFGNIFDVNNLSLISGISFIIILYITRYTSRREKKNLRIALHAISQRYPDPEDYLNNIAKLIDITPQAMLQNIDFKNEQPINDNQVRIYNYIRRKYHYNFLSMNEVFTIPKDLLSEKEHGEERKESISIEKSKDESILLSYFLYIPFGIYFLIFINDLSTIDKAWAVNPIHAILQTGISYYLLVKIGNLSRRCNNEKLITQSYFDHVYNNRFKFETSKVDSDIHERKKFKSKRTQLLYNFFYPFAISAELVKNRKRWVNNIQ